MKQKRAAVFLSILFLLCSLLPVNFSAAKEKSVSPFRDVKPGAWYYEEVMEMAEREIFRGYEDQTFQPKRAISFAEFVAVAARCVSLKTENTGKRHWASDVMDAALKAGWYDWDECPPDNTSRWNQPISRQVAAKVLMKAFAPQLRGDYSRWADQIKDFSEIDGRYYEGVLAAYESGVLRGYETGKFYPKKGITRAESCAVFFRALQQFPQEDIEPLPSPDPSPNPPAASGGVSQNGQLKVVGTRLCNEAGESVMLRGMSSHGLQWYSQFTSKEAIAFTSKYGANVFRVAMYTQEGGYLSNKSTVKAKLIEAVDNALSLDLYVVIDWHILSDGDPNSHTGEAKEFFSELSRRYRNHPGVLYEICNEPNGGVSWGDISRYASQVIPVIRKNSPNAVIFCGTPTWSQDVDEAAKKPLPYENVMYSLHFYAGTHGQSLKDKAENALKKGLPLFVTEWGTSDASGSGGNYLSESESWLAFLEKHGIGWINWSFCDKGESSAALLPGAAPSRLRERDLSRSGAFVFSKFQG